MDGCLIVRAAWPSPTPLWCPALESGRCRVLCEQDWFSQFSCQALTTQPQGGVRCGCAPSPALSARGTCWVGHAPSPELSTPPTPASWHLWWIPVDLDWEPGARQHACYRWSKSNTAVLAWPWPAWELITQKLAAGRFSRRNAFRKIDGRRVNYNWQLDTWMNGSSAASQLNGSCEPTCDWLMTFYINDV